MAKNQNKGKPRNYALETGVYRFGKSSTYHKKAIYKFTKKTNAKKAAAKSPVFVEKKIGGAKNGGTRMVRVKKLANDYPTQDAPAPGTSVNFFSKVRKIDIDFSDKYMGSFATQYNQQFCVAAQEDCPLLPVRRHRGHPPGRCPQGEESRGPEAAGDWAASGHRPLQTERNSPQKVCY